MRQCTRGGESHWGMRNRNADDVRIRRAAATTTILSQPSRQRLAQRVGRFVPRRACDGRVDRISIHHVNISSTAAVATSAMAERAPRKPPRRPARAADHAAKQAGEVRRSAPLLQATTSMPITPH